MIVITENSEDFLLEGSQICILCESHEIIPLSFTISKKTYAPKMAAVIPYEYTQKGILKGSIFESTTCIISGCDEADSFKELYVPEENIKQVCKEIWDNPDKYSDYKKDSEKAYYNFLKYLYVKFPDGTEKSLHDVANS